MEKSNEIKISSVFLTALVLVSFRTAAASQSVVKCYKPQTSYYACPGSSDISAGPWCDPHPTASGEYSCNRLKYLAAHPWLADPSKKKHIRLSTTSSVSPLVKKLLAETKREDFIAVFEEAGKAGGVIVNQVSYPQLTAKANSFGIKLFAVPVSKDLYKIGIKSDTAKVSDSSDHGRIDSDRIER
ncbi:MAG: hypothetical protein K0S08_1991 [Gammaproteobacteria bacterium]|jgi:hypothetical protein|nr:hypothetical protein [Gammaproteobacteria bacterium]MCE3238242.1 hypothetical protein [Gammaproteobacteria bacterium]